MKPKENGRSQEGKDFLRKSFGLLIAARREARRKTCRNLVCPTDWGREPDGRKEG